MNWRKSLLRRCWLVCVGAHPSLRRLSVPLIGGLLWLTIATVGAYAMFAYEITAGEDGTPPHRWPAQSAIALSEGRSTLLLFAHPKCPCTRKSMEHLLTLATLPSTNVHVVVVFTVPKHADQDWLDSEIVHQAQDEDSLSVVVDHDGTEAQTFSIATSGHALLFDARGQLRYSGGLTAGRGMEGPNAGLEALTALLTDSPTTDASLHSRFAVFGCRLVKNSKEAVEADACPRP